MKNPFKSVDRLLGRSLLGLQNDEWRAMRHHLSPAFTGSKLRGMIGLVESTCDKFSNFLSSRPDYNEPLDMYTSFRRMAADVIASTAFGFTTDAINDSEADFYKNGIKLMDFSGRRKAIMMGYFTSPA
jgi:cytochrome P450 family 9